MASRVVVIALSCAVAGGLRVPASPRVCASGRAIAPRNFAARARPPRLQASGGPPPPEVIEAEANATPNRKFRLAGAAALGLLSAGSALASVTELTGGGGDVTEARVAAVLAPAPVPTRSPQNLALSSPARR